MSQQQKEKLDEIIKKIQVLEDKVANYLFIFEIEADLEKFKEEEL